MQQENKIFCQYKTQLVEFMAVLRIHEILVRIRIRWSIYLANRSDADPDPAIFVNNLLNVNKKLLFFQFFCLLLFKGTFTTFFKDKNS